MTRLHWVLQGGVTATYDGKRIRLSHPNGNSIALSPVLLQQLFIFHGEVQKHWPDEFVIDSRELDL